MRTRTTVGWGKTRRDIRVTVFLTPQLLTLTLVTLRTGDHLVIPINDKTTDIKAFTAIGLPTTTATYGTHEIDVILLFCIP